MCIPDCVESMRITRNMMKYLIILALLASVIDECNSLTKKPISASGFIRHTSNYNRLEARCALHSMISSQSSMFRNNFAPMFMSNRMTLDTSDDDDMEEDVTHLDEAELRAFWERSGMSASSYDEDIALSKMMMADIDDDDDSDGTFVNNDLMDYRSAGDIVADKTKAARKKKNMSSSSPVTSSVKIVSSTSKGGLLSRKLLSRTSKRIVSKEDSQKNKENFITDATATKEDTNEKIEKNDVENNLAVPVNDIPAGRSVGENILRRKLFIINIVNMFLFRLLRNMI